MIRKQDILDRAAAWQLRPDVVEKDYALGWLLAGIAELPFGPTWIFKGGTCIKKCYAETYRFSEDLDFSLLPEAAYSQEELTDHLRQLVARVNELSGLVFASDGVDVRPRLNRRGERTFEGRIAYRGPLAFPGQPRIRFDFTRHEPVLDAPSLCSIMHPYTDELPADARVNAYSFNELLAEKTRALIERSRPRDLYDVVHLLESASDGIDLAGTRNLLVRKCDSKAVVVPSCAGLVADVLSDAELRSEWGNMLAHQLPVLPDLKSLLERLPSLMAWLDGPATAPRGRVLPRVQRAAHETPVFTRGIQFWGAGSPVETIRFAATNRLLLEFDYHGHHRRVEPYALRQAQTGNLLVYGWELASAQIKAFKVQEMQDVRASEVQFAPRFAVEISMFSPPARTTTGAMTTAPLPRMSARPRTSTGPVFVYRCTYCGKRFRRTAQNAVLPRHKDKAGWDCPSSIGEFVATRR